jgi:hypothetical protein
MTGHASLAVARWRRCANARGRVLERSELPIEVCHVREPRTPSRTLMPSCRSSRYSCYPCLDHWRIPPLAAVTCCMLANVAEVALRRYLVMREGLATPAGAHPQMRSLRAWGRNPSQIGESRASRLQDSVDITTRLNLPHTNTLGQRLATTRALTSPASSVRPSSWVGPARR